MMILLGMIVFPRVQ